jgi:hypothetical protein
MKHNETIAQWLNFTDAGERAADRFDEAATGDKVAQDYVARQLAKAARYCLLAIYYMETGLNQEEAQAIATALVKLTAGRFYAGERHESHGERRGH